MNGKRWKGVAKTRILLQTLARLTMFSFAGGCLWWAPCSPPSPHSLSLPSVCNIPAALPIRCLLWGRQSPWRRGEGPAGSGGFPKKLAGYCEVHPQPPGMYHHTRARTRSTSPLAPGWVVTPCPHYLLLFLSPHVLPSPTIPKRLCCETFLATQGTRSYTVGTSLTNVWQTSSHHYFSSFFSSKQLSYN